jgi:protein SCO1/2
MKAKAAALVLAAALLGAAPRTDRLQGIVVGIGPGPGIVTVRHEPFGGMPGMTMPFAVPGAAGLHVGDAIEATVEEAGSPWRLSAVRVVGPAPPEPYVPVLEPGAMIPDIPLVDQAGRPFSLRRLGGRAALVSFIYTRCGDATMCPLVSAKFSRLQRAIDPATTRLVEITLDPAFDTPAVLERYGRAFGARPDRWTLATGSPGAAGELAKRLGIVSLPGGPGTIAHSEALVAVAPDGRLVERIEGNDWTVEEALAVAGQASRRPVNPIVALTLALASGIGAMCGGGRSGITLAGAIALFAGLLGLFGAIAARTLRKAL